MRLSTLSSACILVGLLLLACEPSQLAIETAIARTQIAIATADVSIVQTQTAIAPTATPVPTQTPAPPLRPTHEYTMAVWHAEISEDMTDKASTILANLGHTGVDPEIQVAPATSMDDELIIIKHLDWPEDADLEQIYFWVLLTVKTRSDYYQLNPQAVIEVPFETKPYGEFDVDNKNILGWCELSWSAVESYLEAPQDIDVVREFIDSWDCHFAPPS